MKYGKLLEHPVFIKTIVTMDLAEKIAAHYGVETRQRPRLWNERSLGRYDCIARLRTMCGFFIKVIEWAAGILASLIVVFMSQLINEHYFGPRRELKTLIRKVLFTIDLYADVMVNPGVSSYEEKAEASAEIRRIAMEYRAFLASYPKIQLSKMDHKTLDSIGPRLIRLSNMVGLRNHEMDSHNEMEIIRKQLSIV